MKRLITRLKDQKLKTVQELQRLNFRIIAVGSSFNDIDEPLLYARTPGHSRAELHLLGLARSAVALVVAADCPPSGFLDRLMPRRPNVLQPLKAVPPLLRSYAMSLNVLLEFVTLLPGPHFRTAKRAPASTTLRMKEKSG
ncbi:hypothetical protein AK812_SmicGene17681 [Symbiodinium microadriaticum]|uniref:Uncharacterized protein n=1 Tax=Symbiodinium microadriaticum TaxID=2951 RepID=A0A1Q9DX30_SYMMI|nr:hypothetical protein AK812_SmicGene17681 [Symbiodinium microadriaticum]